MLHPGIFGALDDELKVRHDERGTDDLLGSRVAEAGAGNAGGRRGKRALLSAQRSMVPGQSLDLNVEVADRPAVEDHARRAEGVLQVRQGAAPCDDGGHFGEPGARRQRLWTAAKPVEEMGKEELVVCLVLSYRSGEIRINSRVNGSIGGDGMDEEPISPRAGAYSPTRAALLAHRPCFVALSRQGHGHQQRSRRDPCSVLTLTRFWRHVEQPLLRAAVRTIAYASHRRLIDVSSVVYRSVLVRCGHNSAEDSRRVETFNAR